MVTEITVLDLETRIDRVLLAASGRSKAPQDMPPPLQSVTAAAMLRMTIGDYGDLEAVHLESREPSEGEAILAASIEEWLRAAHARGGELITFNGSHDLSVIRIALLRSRKFGGGGAAAWLAAGARHRDLMIEMAGHGRRSRLSDIAVGLGFAGPSIPRSAADAGGAATKAELDVCLTAILYFYLEGERRGDERFLTRALLSFGRFIARRAIRESHLASLLSSPLYAHANHTLRD